MLKEEKRECFKILGVDNCSTENEIKRAYKKLALQFHPDKNQNDFSGRKEFEEVSKAFESLTLEYKNDSFRQDYDLVFFDFLRDIFGWKEDHETANASNFLMYFCGSRQHLCTSEMDYDLRYQETEEEEDIDGESDLDSILEIIKNRRKKGKHVPDEFKEENLLDMKSKLNQHKEDMKRDASKKQTNKKGKTPVPVAKPKPKSKKQLLAEQRRREKEMIEIAMELEEKRKEEEEKEKQRKQLEVEKQKKLEEERIKAQNEERKRREREQKEREKQQKLEQEKEEKRHRQQEEERKRREEEDKRRRAEKEKADKEKAAKKAAQQAAKEKEEKEKASNKNQNMKRQQQQQRTDQQQYPREIPPRFQKKKQQQQQQQQQTQSQPPQQLQQQQQQAKIQPKPPPTVGKKKDPNRFASKEYAGIIEPMDDSEWSQSTPAKGSGWGNALETWEDSDKWGSVDRQWGDKEGTWEELVVDGADKDNWPTIGNKGTIGDKIKPASSETSSEKGQQSSESSPKTSVSSMSMFKSDNLPSAHNTVLSSNVDKKLSSSGLPSSGNNWQGLYPAPSENWDVTDESIDQAIDAAEAASTKEPVGIAANWGGVARGGLGGLIGTRDSSLSVQSEEFGVHELANNPGLSEAQGWSKTPGKGFKTKVPTTTTTVGTSSVTTSWGGTPAENTRWTEANTAPDGLSNSNGNKPSLTEANAVALTKPAADSKSDQNEMSPSCKRLSGAGWGETPTTSSSTWGVSADITGAACWDSSTAHKSDTGTEPKTCNNSKVSQWLESTDDSLPDIKWGQESVELEEGSDGPWDGWTTASKRNRAPKPPANDTNAWMNRSLKQLLDMGFKQEDAEKALKANHMNIESAIGDLLALNLSENRGEAIPMIAGKLQEPDPAEAARIQQQQQQSQSKMNRKQRRKLQQQQQQQQGEQQIPGTTTELKQVQTELLLPKSETQSSVTLSNLAGEQQGKALETLDSRPEETQLQPDSKTKLNMSIGKGDKAALPGATKPSNPQAQIPGNVKRMVPPVIPTPAQGAGAQSPLRPPLGHPLLHPLVPHFHLQQLRMAQGGLLQPSFTPQLFALLQQIAQLQLVQQRLAAQSVAQQHIGQKHGQQVLPSQQQLYQQQQQIALMIAQMQQQVLQQQPSLAGRHPALQFAAVQQQSLLQQQQAAANVQHKNSKPLAGDKAAGELPQGKTSETVKSQPNELPGAPSVASDEHTLQPSPVPQSRLTQWKQPLLQDPNAASQQSVSSSASTSVDSKPQTAASSTQQPTSVSPGLMPPAHVPTIDVSEPQAPGSSNSSPRTRISDPVSSRWGVDAGPKLSADPPEFKPGVPWRPVVKSDKNPDGRDVVSPGAVPSPSPPVSSNSEPSSSDSWPSPANQNASAPSSVPLTSAGKTAGDSNNTTTNTGFSGASFNNSTFPGQAQFDLGLGSTPWQATESKTSSYPQGATKPARPPPGLGSDNALPESPLFDDEPPEWLKRLIDGTSTNLNADKEQPPQFPFSRFGFANNAAPWSPREGGSQPFAPLASNPQPWAAPGGPAPTLSSSASPVSMATSGPVVSGTMSSASEAPKLQNPGIIWSANQPIPSAEEKLTGGLPVASGPVVTSSSGVAPSRNIVNPMSTWLVLCNLTPRIDPKALRSLCEKHGPLLTFQLNLRHGNSLIRYGSMEEAAKARAVLNGMMLNGTQMGADFATDGDIGSFFEQTMDWSANPFPSNTYGNQWSFQNVIGSAATSNDIQTSQAPATKNQLPVSTTSEQQAPKPPPPAAGMQWGAPLGAMPVQANSGGEQPGSKPNPTAAQWGSTPQGSEREQPGAKPNQVPTMQWGNAPGPAPLPSYLWGSGPSQQSLGGNFAQVPSMWSFPAGVPREAEPQSGSGENGLVSPSMTTFLPPGLLNGGGDSV